MTDKLLSAGQLSVCKYSHSSSLNLDNYMKENEYRLPLSVAMASGGWVRVPFTLPATTQDKLPEITEAGGIFTCTEDMTLNLNFQNSHDIDAGAVGIRMGAIQINNNGAVDVNELRSHDISFPVGGIAIPVSSSLTYEFSSGDTFAVWSWQTSGGNLDLIGDDNGVLQRSYIRVNRIF